MSKRISRASLEAAARIYLSEEGFVYDGSIVDCARSRDPDVYNPRCSKAVLTVRKIIRAADKAAGGK